MLLKPQYHKYLFSTGSIPSFSIVFKFFTLWSCHIAVWFVAESQLDLFFLSSLFFLLVENCLCKKIIVKVTILLMLLDKLTWTQQLSSDTQWVSRAVLRCVVLLESSLVWWSWMPILIFMGSNLEMPTRKRPPYVPAPALSLPQDAQSQRNTRPEKPSTYPRASISYSRKNGFC